MRSRATTMRRWPRAPHDAQQASPDDVQAEQETDAVAQKLALLGERMAERALAITHASEGELLSETWNMSLKSRNFNNHGYAVATRKLEMKLLHE